MTTESVREGVARGQVLAREVGEFLIELAIALQKHAIYPRGHPALARVSGRVLERVTALLEPRPSLSLGVARTQLVIEGIATDASHPVLRQLALRFHEHHLAALRFERGLEAEELTELLLVLSTESGGDRADPVGLRERLPSWPHLRLSALGLGDLEIVSPEAAASADGSRLWLDLARAALADERAQAELGEQDLAPSVVADAIDRRSGSGTYDQVIAGYLIEITRAVKAGGGRADTGALADRLNGLVRALSPETLRRLMAHGGDRDQQRTFVQDAAAGLPVDTVVQLLTASAEAADRPISELLLRLYGKLATHARADGAASAAVAEAELRNHVSMLVDGWTLPDPNPEAYGRALTALSKATVRGPAVPAEPVTPDRLLKMCLELDFAGAVLERAVDRLLEEGGAGEALELLGDAAPNAATAAARARLGRLENLRALMAAAGLETGTVAALVEGMGEPGAAALLDLLMVSEDRGARRRAFDVLVALGPGVAPLADARLEGETRWYALRNLLALQAELGTQPAPAVELDRLAAHEDGRVRREALKLLLRDPGARDRALTRVLADPDARVVQLARSVEEGSLPAGVIPLLVGRVGDAALPEPLQASLVRLLGWSAEPEARDALIGMVVRGRGLLGRLRLESGTPVVLSALEVLATRWGDDPTAARVLQRARSAKDAGVRAAAGGAP